MIPVKGDLMGRSRSKCALSTPRSDGSGAKVRHSDPFGKDEGCASNATRGIESPSCYSALYTLIQISEAPNAKYFQISVVPMPSFSKQRLGGFVGFQGVI